MVHVNVLCSLPCCSESLRQRIANELEDVQLLFTDPGLSRGQLQGCGAWFGDSLEADPQTVGPTLAKQAHVSSPPPPLHTLLLGFEIVAGAKRSHSFNAEVLHRPSKIVSRQHKQAETNLIQFARKRSLRHRLPSANLLAPGSAPADFAETWYLD